MNSRFRVRTDARTTAFRDAVVPPAKFNPSRLPQVPRDSRLLWPQLLFWASVCWVFIGLYWQYSESTAPQPPLSSAASPISHELRRQGSQILQKLVEGQDSWVSRIPKPLSQLDRAGLPYNIPLFDEVGPWTLFVTADLDSAGQVLGELELSGRFLKLTVRYAGEECDAVVIPVEQSSLPSKSQL